MGAKLKYKTHLQNKFFNFFEPFRTLLASKFANIAKILEIIKNPIELHAKFKSGEKVTKNAHTKNYKRTNFTKISKSGKSAYVPHVYFFWCFFYNFFKGFEISMKFCIALCDTHH